MKRTTTRLFGLLALAIMVLAPAAFPVASDAQIVTAQFSPGDLIKGSGSAVYYFAPNGRRFVFPNEKTYFTWYVDFSTVRTIPDNALSSLPLGGNVTYRPGMKLVKITTDPRVYAVERAGVLRHISSEQLAAQLYGINWATQVQDVPDAFFVNYTVGGQITNVNQYIPQNVVTLTTSIAQDKNLPFTTAGAWIGDVAAGFVPQTMNVRVGTTVTWTNSDIFNSHTVTSDTGVFDSGTLTPNRTFVFTFNTAGTFAYHDSLHPGMQGRINVITP
ncbi:MAG: hypothetical protein Q7R83_02460 [bacterium]|nr:hypothetical protein [bacterium]